MEYESCSRGGQSTEAPKKPPEADPSRRSSPNRFRLPLRTKCSSCARGRTPKSSPAQATLGRRDTDRTTSEVNIESVRAIVDAWNRGDWDAVMERVAPEIEFDASSIKAEWRGVYRGRDEVKRVWQAFSEPWESIRGEIEEFIPAPGDALVTRQTAYFRGRNGIEVINHTNFVFQFQDGVVVRWLFFNDLADALAAAGLSASA